MPTPDHPSFPQPDDPSILAWRYIDTPKLVALLLRKELNLRRVDLLPDKFEGTYPKPTRSALLSLLTSAPPEGAGLDIDKSKQMVDQLTKTSTSLRKTFYASCWRLGNHESEAMWRLYCGTGEGVALVVQYARLRDSIYDNQSRSFLGVVRYIDYEADLIAAGNLLSPVMHKRREFEHEHEARLISWRPPEGENWATRDLPASIAMPWNPEDHIQEIVISPYADTWYLETVRELVARIAPALAERIKQSVMGGSPYV